MVDPDHFELGLAISRLQDAGYVKFEISKDRFTGEWSIHATRFEMEEE